MPPVYHAACANLDLAQRTRGAVLLAHALPEGASNQHQASRIEPVESRRLGGSGIVVTRIVLGCGNFGGVGSSPAFFGQGIPKEVAFRIMDAAWDLGIRAFDTADAYGGGRSETWIGEWLATKPSAVRDQIVIETKTFNPMAEGEDGGLGRSRILRQVEASLRRLGVDRVPLYFAHAFDPDVPQEETLSAFDELVRAGKVGAVGASNFTGDQLAEALEISELEGLARYEVVQNAYSLLERDDAETVFPVCREHGLGYECFSPLAGGWLTGKYRRGEAYPRGSRMTQRPEGYVGFVNDDVFSALERLEEEAVSRGVSMAGLALGWLLAQPDVSAVVVGPGRPEHLQPVWEALELDLEGGPAAALTEVFASDG
jgi:aryl-alcohol dehydrogenase-like predicted oxidoreductase